MIFYQAIIILWDWIYSIDCVTTTPNDLVKVSDQLLRLRTFVLPEYVQETFASDICYQIGITCNKSFKTFQKEPEYHAQGRKQWNYCNSRINAIVRTEIAHNWVTKQILSEKATDQAIALLEKVLLLQDPISNALTHTCIEFAEFATYFSGKRQPFQHFPMILFAKKLTVIGYKSTNLHIYLEKPFFG